MRRESVVSLGEALWFKPLEGDDLEISIVPSKLVEFAQLSSGDAFTEERALRDGFVDFRGYTEDGKPVANSVNARRELLSVIPIRTAIKAKVWELNGEVSKGEASAASV